MAMKRCPTHRCFAPDCQKDVPNKHLMCFRHWKRVPDYLQCRIVEAWRDGLRHQIHPTFAYDEAITEARALLRAQDEKRLAKLTAKGGFNLAIGGA